MNQASGSVASNAINFDRRSNRVNVSRVGLVGSVGSGL